MYFRPVLVLILVSYVLLSDSDHHFIAFVDGGKAPSNKYYSIGDAAINCGYDGHSTALDGREWIGDAPSKFLSGKSRTSAAAEKSFSIDPVPYKTSRISSTEFSYTFEVNPGQKFIRLHFHPATYRGFENSIDFFAVKAGPFILLRDFSASLTAETMGVNYLVKEFCLNVEENRILNITFLPSLITKSKLNVYAFVNGIEIISMPTGLYYTLDGDLGARVVGQKNRFYNIDNTTALEVTHRLNIGGSSISSLEDFGMFRRWSEDTNYLLQPGVHRVNHQALRIKYAHMPEFIAPPKLYQTSWKAGGSVRVNWMYSITWKIPLELGFGYLLRLHFCELDDGMAEGEQREFSVLIDNHIVETQADVIRWSGGNGIPTYRDYMVKMKGDSKCDLLIALQSANELVFGLLNGLEIIKLSDLENSLATPNPTFPKRVSASWNLTIQKVFLAFGQSNVVVTGMTIIMILVNIVVYSLRQIWEEKFLEIDTQGARNEPSYHRFSLVEIKLATQNFSDAFVIGMGGFGIVYRGFISSISEFVAIKRLKSGSRQGAYEFWTEIETLSKLRHVHLVSLLGYCNEGQEMILVYDYMPCGTLADNLYKLSRKGKDIAPLSWEQRLRICIGAARGLEYLHTGTECTVIHRDVKDSNILLDESFVAKISDFGLSKLEKKTQSKSYVSTKVKGTAGYLDPEYVMTRRLTRKSDVYAFGVVLLVVLSGRPAVDTKAQEEQQILVSCFRECITEGDIDRIVDPNIQGKIPTNSLREFQKSIENCLHHLPKKRPTMAQVVASLEQALERQESPMIYASSNATVVGQEEVPVFGENAIPEEGNTRSSTCDPYSPTRGNELRSRRKEYSRVPKPSWNWRWRAVWNRGNKQKAEVSLFGLKPEELPLYSYKTLANATNDFHSANKIGNGGFGRIYKGNLLTGQAIAVKMLSSSAYQGNMEFMNEVLVISKLHHRNIVRLLGCCVESEFKMLIYEYVPNKSLDAYIFDIEKRYILDWSRRAIIIEGIGRGLLYLHRDSSIKIIHRDLKPSNVFLDGELKPKISDHTLARIIGNQDESETSRIVGTFAYMAPEYVMYGKFSDKSDVYSYGVLLLEIISGKKNSIFYYDDKGQSLTGWAWKLWNANKTVELIDSALLSPPNETEISRYVQVGLLCVQESSKDRPNMSTVLSMLSGEIEELPRPKLPAFCSETECDPPCAPSVSDFPPCVFSVNDLSLTTIQGR